MEDLLVPAEAAAMLSDILQFLPDFSIGRWETPRAVEIYTAAITSMFEEARRFDKLEPRKENGGKHSRRPRVFAVFDERGITRRIRSGCSDNGGQRSRRSDI